MAAHCSRGRLVRVRFPAKSNFPTDRLTFWLARRRPTRNQVTVAQETQLQESLGRRGYANKYLIDITSPLLSDSSFAALLYLIGLFIQIHFAKSVNSNVVQDKTSYDRLPFSDSTFNFNLLLIWLFLDHSKQAMRLHCCVMQ